MRRYLLDTGQAGDLISRRRGVDVRVREATLRGDHVGICIPVLGELWAGMELSASRERNVQRLRLALAKLRIWPYDVQAAEEYGRIMAALRRKGVKIQQIDMQIAAIALTIGNCTVVSGDSDLRAVPGLAVETWSV
jgi:tRNA(fMet)-specific endonuclease VapC